MMVVVCIGKSLPVAESSATNLDKSFSLMGGYGNLPARFGKEFKQQLDMY